MNVPTIYHTLEWRDVLTDTYGYEPIYYGYDDDNTFFPCMIVRSSLLRKTFAVSLPFSDEAGPFGSDPERVREGLARLDRIYEERKLDYIEIKGLPDPGLLAASKSHGYREVFENFRFEINLDLRIEEIRKGFSQNIRRSLTKVTPDSAVEVNPPGCIRQFYHLYLATMKRLGTPPHNIRFIENMRRIMPDNCYIIVGYKNSSPAAAIIVLTDPNRAKARYIMGARDHRHDRDNINTLVFFESIRFFKSQGCQVFDFGVTIREQPGLWAFKEKWCASRPRTEYYLYKSRYGDVIDPRSARIMLFSRIWANCVPAGIAKRIGPIIRKQIAK